MKGVTAIIAIVLLLMITISMTGFVYLFLQRSFESASESSDSQIAQQSRSILTMMKVDSVSGNKIYIRNVGSVPISNSSLGVYIGNSAVNYTLDSDVAPGQVAEMTINGSWELPLGSSEIRITGVGAAYSEPVSIAPDSSVVLSLGMDEGYGSAAHDSSGYGNDGSLYGIGNGTCYNMGGGSGITECNWLTGIEGYAMGFDGGNDYILTQYNGSFLQNMTASAWFKASSLGANAVFGRFHTVSVDHGWMLYRNPGDAAGSIFWLYYYKNTGGTTSYVRPGYSGIALDTWYHASSSISSDGSWRTYLNGIPYTSGTASSFAASGWGGATPNPAVRMAIGKGSEVAGWYFNGSIDGVRVYDRTLSPAEISSIFNGSDTASLRYGLIGEWKFSEGAGNGTADTHMWTEGRFGQALQFDGLDDYLNVRKGITRSDILSTGMTLSAWIRFSAAGNQLIIGQDTNSGCSYCCLGGLELSSGHARMVIYNGSSYIYATGTSLLNDGNWHHVMGSYGTDRYMRVYSDGKLDASAYTADVYNALPVNISIGMITERTRFYYPFRGAIDQATVYNKTLTPEQVQELA